METLNEVVSLSEKLLKENPNSNVASTFYATCIFIRSFVVTEGNEND